MCGGDRQKDIPAQPETMPTAADDIFAVAEPRLASPRESCVAKWFVDGKEMFSAVSADLLGASKSIWITGWMVTPRMDLVRGGIRSYSLRAQIEDSPRTKADHAAAVNMSRRITTKGDLLLLKYGDVPDQSLLYHLISAAIRGVDVRVLLWADSWNLMGTDSKASHAMLVAAQEVVEYLRQDDKGGIQAHRCTVDVPGWDVGNYGWSHHQKTVIIDGETAYVGGIDLARGRWDTSEHSLDGGREEFKGDFYNATLPEGDRVPATSPRLPWHDVHVRLQGEAAGDVARNFQHRWYKQTQGTNLSRDKEDFAKLDAPPPEASVTKGEQTVQIVRSICTATGGLIGGILKGATEKSIHEVYEKNIENAKNFIYIENQYLMSRSAWCPSEQNCISRALVKRIRDAIHEDFQDISAPSFFAAIVLPVTPDATDGLPRRRQLFYEYATVAHILGVLRSEIEWAQQTKTGAASSAASIDDLLRKYVGFYSLYKFDKVDQKKLFHGEIYPHVKAMIVDDRVSIIGSANMFDRSLTGDGDSEIAAVVHDRQLGDGLFGGASWETRKFASSLRKRLWSEHLGVDESEVVDPLRTYHDVWIPRALNNAKLFEDAFSNMPRADAYQADPKHMSNWRQSADKDRLPPVEHVFLSPSELDDRLALRQAGYEAGPTAGSFIVPEYVCTPRKFPPPGPNGISGLSGVKGQLIPFPIWSQPSVRPGVGARYLGENEERESNTAAT